MNTTDPLWTATVYAERLAGVWDSVASGRLAIVVVYTETPLLTKIVNTEVDGALLELATGVESGMKVTKVELGPATTICRLDEE